MYIHIPLHPSVIKARRPHSMSRGFQVNGTRIAQIVAWLLRHPQNPSFSKTTNEQNISPHEPLKNMFSFYY